MLRLGPRFPHAFLPLARLARRLSTVPKPPPLASLADQDHMRQARDWLAAFEGVSPDDWPKRAHMSPLPRFQPPPRLASFTLMPSSATDLFETSFTRSSGPGGQHVNRTFSKATVRLPLPSPTLVPPYALPHLRHSPHYASSALLVSSSAQRTQQSNLADAMGKLKAAIVDAAGRDLVGETTKEQKERVKGLVAREKKKVEKVKKMRKDVKGGRGKVRGWE